MSSNILTIFNDHFIEFVSDEYVTVCIETYDDKFRSVCMLVYPNEWKNIEIIGDYETEAK